MLTLQNSLGKSRTFTATKGPFLRLLALCMLWAKHLLTGNPVSPSKSTSQVRMGVPLCMLDALIHLLAASAYILKRIGGLKSLDAFILILCSPLG